MDILSLTNNVRVGQEVEPRGIKPTEQNLGKEVRESGSPPKRGAPSLIRADRKEASQIEPKPLLRALDLLESELPIELNFRDLALNKKIRPGAGLEKALVDLDLHVENGKPKLKDLLAVIGVDVPTTLSTRNLTILQHAIAEKIDGPTVPIPIKHLIETFLRTDNVPVAQAYQIDEAAPDGRVPSIDSGGRSSLIRSEDIRTPVTSSNRAQPPLPVAYPQPVPGIQSNTGGGIRNSTDIPRPYSVLGSPRPIGVKDFFIEMPRPGVVPDMWRMPIKIAPELGANRIEVRSELPPVNLETMAAILNKGLSPTALREPITTQAAVPKPVAGPLPGSMPTPRPLGSEPHKEAAPLPVSQTPATNDGKTNAVWPKTSARVPTIGPPPTPEAHAPGALITPESFAGRKPRLDRGPVPSISNQVPVSSSSRPLSAVKTELSGLDIGFANDARPDFEVAALRTNDLAVPLSSNVLEGARRTQDGSVLRQAAQQIVSSVHDSIVDHIEEIAASQGRGRVVIRLQPEDLGSITISVRSFGQRVEADIRASNDAVRDALVANRGDLVQSVESKGLSLDSFNVGQEADGEPQTSDQRADRGNDMRREFERFANVSRASHKDVPVTAAAPWLAPSTEVVDYTV